MFRFSLPSFTSLRTALTQLLLDWSTKIEHANNNKWKVENLEQTEDSGEID